MSEDKSLFSGLKLKDPIEGVVVVTSYEKKDDSTGKPMLYLELSSGSIKMSAKKFAAYSEPQTMIIPTLVKISGFVDSYNNKEYLKLNLIEEAPNADLSGFVRMAPMSVADMKAAIKSYVDRIDNVIFRKIVVGCMNPVWKEFFESPAAKSNHHDFYGGLAYHEIRMLEIGDFLIKQRPFLSYNLLASGILLHDLEKVHELLSRYGIVSAYSTVGNLVGHISMVDSLITKVCVEQEIPLDCEEVIALRHVVLAHHGKGEWGSPVNPQMAEAVALHHIDNLDAKLQAVEDALETVEVGNFTPPIYALDRTAFYNHGLK